MTEIDYKAAYLHHQYKNQTEGYMFAAAVFPLFAISIIDGIFVPLPDYSQGIGILIGLFFAFVVWLKRRAGEKQ